MNQRQESLKRKQSVAGSRSLRAHKRDVERKIRRDETLSRHRNLSAMSPLKENVGNIKAGQKTSQEVKGKQDATESRRQMLQKWKAERELKKKLQQREQGKKPVFRVTHIVPETVPFSKPLPKHKNVDAPIEVPDRRVTRASIAAAKAPARSTRSSNIAEKVSGPSVARKRPSTRATKTTQEAAPASRSVRSRGPASVPAVTAISKPPPSRTTRRTGSRRTDARRSLTGTWQARGESTSFAPDNFEFAPPENVSQVVFNPLSPVSAHSFMFTAFNTTTDSRRCSTPKVVLKRMSTVHSPSVSVIRPVSRSGTKMNSTAKASALPEAVSDNGVRETVGVEPDTLNDSVQKSTIEKAASGEKKNVTFSPVSSGDTMLPDFSTTAPVMSLKEAMSSNEENMPPPVSTSVIRTPGRVPRRRHTSAELPTSSRSSSSKKTPKYNSLILQHLSPEDRVDVLLHSPMVEMRRRTPKAPGINIELPNFDDLDLSIAADPFTDICTTDDTRKLTAHVATEEKPAGNISDTPVTGTDTAAAGSDTAATGSDTVATGSDTVAMVATGSATGVAGSDTAVAESDTADLVTKVKPDDDLLPEHDVSYFRELLVSETKRLTAESEKWNEIITLTDHLSEEVEGQIRTTVGQAQLLMHQRFKQFSGLVDNCEFGTGEKATLCTDLQGFWDMIYFQVQDVDNKFAELSKLRSNNWVKELKQQPKRKKILKKPAAKKPVAAARSKFGTFLTKMKQQKAATVAEQEKEGNGASGKEGDGVVTKEARTEDNTIVGKEEEAKSCPVGTETDTKMKIFDGGFFTVNSPVHSPVLQRKHGSSAKKSLSRSGSKSGSRANTPGGSCNSKSLLVSVMTRISQSAQCRSSSPRLSGGGCDSPRTTRRSVATTPSDVSTGWRRRSRRSLAVCVESDTPSVFSPRDTDMLDRCAEGVGGETDAAPGCCKEPALSKYLVPTKLPEHESMDVDQPASIGDVDMSSQMKRNLSAEFDRQSLSRERRTSRSALVTPKHPKSGVKRQRNATQVSGRRSVRFVDASDSPTYERLPVTPFNKDSLVPRKRSDSSTCHSDSATSPTFLAALVEHSDSDTPVRRLAQLTVKHTPAGRTATPMTKMPNLNEVDEGETCERPPVIRDNLMSFSPVFMTSPVKKPSAAARTPNLTPRRSTRLSLL